MLRRLRCEMEQALLPPDPFVPWCWWASTSQWAQWGDNHISKHHYCFNRLMPFNGASESSRELQSKMFSVPRAVGEDWRMPSCSTSPRSLHFCGVYGLFEAKTLHSNPVKGVHRRKEAIDERDCRRPTANIIAPHNADIDPLQNRAKNPTRCYIFSCYLFSPSSELTSQ